MRHFFAVAVQALAVLAQSATYDTIVVGGGLSGLSAAKALKAAGKSFLVLEARDRVGGRVDNHILTNGAPVELGAAFIGPTQDKVIALAAELGLELYPEYDTGNNILYHKGEATPFAASGPTGAIPPVDIISLLQIVVVQAELDVLASGIDVMSPWTHFLAPIWDKITLDGFFKSKLLTPTARFILDSAVQSIFSVEARELSLLYTLSYIAAAGNETTKGTLERLTQTTGGAQMWKVNGGTELLATKLAERVGNIVLGAPVQSISRQSNTSPYAVTLRNGTTFQGTHVIVAMSPPIADLIQYSPALPADRVAIQQKMKMGVIGKAIAIYDSPFWRADGLTGQVVSDAGLGRVTYEMAPKDASANTWGGIMSFLEADRLREYINATDAEIAAEVQKDFVNYFGSQANNVKEWVVTVWNREEFSRGGPVAVAATDIYTKHGPALRARVGNLHFAGTESSDYWVGYMEGALRAGARAAAETI